MEFTEYFRFIVALLFVLGLIGACAWVAKRAGFTPRIEKSAGGGRRLAIVDMISVDMKRKLILVRRDDREHLVLLSEGGDLLVEGGIDAPALAASGPAAHVEPEVTGNLPGQPLGGLLRSLKERRA